MCKYLSSGSLIGDDPADDRYEAWYDGTGEPLLLGEEDGDLEYKGDIPKIKVVEIRYMSWLRAAISNYFLGACLIRRVWLLCVILYIPD